MFKRKGFKELIIVISEEIMMIRKSISKITTGPPISVRKIVLLRTTTIMLLLLTTLLMTMAIMLRPWKTEFVEGTTKNMEIGIFHVCRASFSKGIKCYPGTHEEAPDPWFMAFRWFLLLSTFSGFAAVFYPIIQLIRTTRQVLNLFVIPAALSLLSGCLSLTSLLMLLGYWDFEHLDDFRLYKMGWKEDLETEEFVNWPNDLAWAACIMFFLDFLLCVYAHFKDTAFMNSFKLNAIREHAEMKMKKIAISNEEALDKEKENEKY